jgi:predicted TPR repeat methyltransferase
MPVEMEPDYRLSHLEKGVDYDDDLSRGNFDTYMTERERELVARIVRRRFPGGVLRSLDFACGTGRITQIVEPLVRESYGVDVSEAMLGVARRKCPRTTFVQADLTKTSLKLPPFELVTAFRFFGNAQEPLRAAGLAAIRNVLAPGGLLILNNHVNSNSLHQRLLRLRGKDRDRGLTPVALRRLLASEGFEVLREHGIGLWMVRYGWNTPAVMRSRAVRAVEPLSRLPGLAPLCPDIVSVARRLA